MSVQELEAAVAHLPREEFALFQAWFEEFAVDVWDARIEADARAGKLDHLIAQADTDFEAGRCTPLAP